MCGLKRGVAGLLCACLICMTLGAAAEDVTPSEATASPAPTATETPQPTMTPFTPQPPEPTATQEPTNAPTPVPTGAPTSTPLPAPVLREAQPDTKQDEPGKVKVHIAVERAQDDARTVELIILLVKEDELENVGEYLKKYPLKDDAFSEKNLLKVDEKDSAKRYAAALPYDTRYILAARIGGGNVIYEGIFAGIPAPQEEPTTEPSAEPTEEPTDEPQETPEPTEEPDDFGEEEDPLTPDEMEEFEEHRPAIGVVYITPKDEDMDGFYSRTEYRLGFDPSLRDSTGSGYWDYMGLYLQGRLSEEPAAQAPDAFEKLAEAGLLKEAAEEENPSQARTKMQKEWERGGAAQIGWIDLRQTRVLAFNARGVFVGNYKKGESMDIERALSMGKIGYPAFNQYQFARSFEASADGRRALLYDRVITKESGEAGGELRADAVLIDTENMRAYALAETKGAKGVAMSPDGSLLAVWRESALEIWSLATGEVTRITDERRLSRVEMLAFTQDNRLVIRVTQMGYNALLADGTATLGGMDELGIFVRNRDAMGMDVYDKDHLSLRVNARLYLVRDGIYVTGEDGKTWRNFSPKYFRQCSAQLRAQ